MTVSSTQAREIYACNGSTTIRAVPFRILDATHLRIVRYTIATGAVVDLVLNTNYTVENIGDPNAQFTTIGPDSPYISDFQLIALRNVPFSQSADYVENDAFPAETHETGLDKLTMLAQQLSDLALRSASLPEFADTSLVVTLPLPEDGFSFVWDGVTGAIRNTTASLADLEGDAEIVADNIASVNTVAASIANVNTVASNIANVNVVGGISADVTTVAGIASAVTATAANETNINTVATDIANVNLVGGSIANVNLVGADITNVNTVAANLTNIDIVAGIAANITTVAGIAANVTTVAGISADVTTVAGMESNIATVVANITDIQNAAANAAIAVANAGYAAEWAIQVEDTPVSVAAGGDGVTDFSSLHWAAKAAASAGSLDLSNYPNNHTGFEDPDSAGVTLNADISKLDISSAKYFIHGTAYNYAGGSAIVPTIGAGDSSTWVGLDSSETLQYQGTKFTDVQLETVLPLARLQSVEGTSGPGSDLTPPVDLRYNIGEEGFVQRIWLRDTLGALFPADGIDGLITENATALRIDQTSGKMYDAQRKPITITGDTQLSARALYHVSGTWTLQNNATVVVPLFYDDQTDIQALPVGKWAAHTLLRSPKDDDSFTLVYSQQQYNSQAEAEAAAADFGLFVSQSVSLFVPVANLIVKGNSTAIESIIDLRPKLTTTAGNVIGTATLQQIYDNSTTPEFTTDSVRGAITIKRGSAADTDNILEGKNGAGTTTFAVTGLGAVAALSFTGDGSGLTNLPAGGFEATTALGSTDDWNTLTTVGLYSTSGTTYDSGPLYDKATVGFLTIRSINGDTSRIQEWYEIDTGDKWLRSYDGTNWTQWECQNYNPKNVLQEFYDMNSWFIYPDNFTSAVTGGTVTNNTTTGVNEKGVINLNTGTGSTNEAAIFYRTPAPRHSVSTAFIRVSARMAIENLSDGTNGFETLFGLTSSAGAFQRTQNYITAFYQEDSANSGNWVCITDDGGTETVTNTTVAPTAGVFQDFRVEVNRDGTEVTFYIDDVLVATHTTNIGTINTLTVPACKIQKTNGTTTRKVMVDKMFKQVERV